MFVVWYMRLSYQRTDIKFHYLLFINVGCRLYSFILLSSWFTNVNLFLGLTNLFRSLNFFQYVKWIWYFLNNISYILIIYIICQKIISSAQSSLRWKFRNKEYSYQNSSNWFLQKHTDAYQNFRIHNINRIVTNINAI